MSEGYLTLGQAAAHCPNGSGGRLSPSTIWRWCRQGVKARGGGTVCLEHRRIGGRVFTTKPWLDAFFAAVTAADRQHFGEAPPPPAAPLALTREARALRAQAVVSSL